MNRGLLGFPLGRSLPPGLLAYPEGRLEPHLASPPIAGYDLWLDGADQDTFVMGTGVTSWKDKSVNQLVAAASGTPLLDGATMAHPALLLSLNASNYLAVTAIAAQSRTATWFWVGRVPVLPGSEDYTAIGSTGSNGALQLGVGSAGRIQLTRASVAVEATQTNAAVVAGVPYVAAAILTATNVTFYNGLTSQVVSAANGFTAGTLLIGKTPAQYGSSPYNGQIGEVLHYPVTLTTTDAEANIAYLMSKWLIS